VKRQIRVDSLYAYIPLTKGYEATIDIEDVPLVEGVNWCADISGRTVYAMRKAGGKTVKLHRLLMGNPVGFEVDHKDGDGLNNRRRGELGNIRIATIAQNRKNQRLSIRNTSGFKGVLWRKDRSKWLARIMADGKSVHLGLFADPKDAHEAYKKASARLHGAFRREV
jgi:hypothetical protein